MSQLHGPDARLPSLTDELEKLEQSITLMLQGKLHIKVDIKADWSLDD